MAVDLFRFCNEQKQERKQIMRRIGMLTSGGDCQALNATMRGVAKVLYNQIPDVEILGFKEGYKGLISSDYRKMKPEDFSGILTIGGTILGSSRQPFKKMRVIEEDGLDKVAAMKETYKKLDLECLIVLGGNGSQKTANLLSEEGLHIISLPKTIDNDIWGTDMTFGFQSAVDIATQAIDCIHTTASSHGRVFIVEIMGHKVGWLTLHAGIASGADVILIPEIPYRMEFILDALKRRQKSGKHFSILAVAEGAVSAEDMLLSRKERKKRRDMMGFPSVSYEIGHEIEKATGQEVRITVPGHTQRGGAPDAYDRFISSRLGAKAGQMVVAKEYGRMAAFDGFKIISVPLKEAAGRLKCVDPKDDTIKEAKAMGICFGDE